MKVGLGYDPALEAQHEAAIKALPRLACAPSGKLPDKVDPREKLPANDQKMRNTCCGNARDKITEFCNLIKTGKFVNLSARFSYLTTKIVDGTINGPDAGASISGAALAAQKYGACEESLLPYWRDDERYSTGIPDAAYAQARDHKIGSYTPLESWDAGREFIGSGQGGIIFGVAWTSGLANFRGRVLTRRDLGGSYLGEHAMCFPGYVENGNSILYNSHGTSWGDNGTAEVSAEVLDYWWGKSSHGFYGLSDLAAFGQREIKTWAGAW